MIEVGDTVRSIYDSKIRGVVRSVRIERPELPPNIWVIGVDLGKKVRVNRIRFFDSTTLRVVKSKEEET
jgi:hypothetical protein